MKLLLLVLGLILGPPVFAKENCLAPSPEVKKILLEKAKKYKLDPIVFEAMIRWESGFTVSARNKEGTENKYRHSIGLGQVQLATARTMGFKGTYEQLRSNPDINLEYAAQYLAKQIAKYGNYRQAISAYNAGTSTTKNQSHVDKIMNYMEELKNGTCGNAGRLTRRSP